ncbi:MAG: hypothetical protein K0U78_21195 [Actinomycetia bacterium]|nr:hypothetical protein [Actinomycetes bacterium]
MTVPIGKPGDLQPPPGVGAGLAIGGFWPSISETDIQDIGDEHRVAAKSFSDYADTLQMQIAQSPERLEGQGGTARIAQLTGMRDHAVDSADHTQSKVVTAESYKSTVVGLKRTLTSIGDAAQEDWEKARSSKRVFNPAPYQAEATSALSTALGDVATAPPPLPVPGEDSASKEAEATPVDHQSQKDEPLSERQDDAEGKANDAASGESKNQGDRNLSERELITADSDSAIGQKDQLISEAPVSGAAGTGSAPVLGTPSSAAPTTPGSGLGSQLGKMKPPQVPSSGLSSLSGKPLTDAATAPASSVSDAFGGSRSPAASAATSFQSGLASGMGSSGAVSPPLEKFAGAQNPAVASASAPGPVVAAQGGPVAPAGGGPPVGSGGPMMGGGAMGPMVPPGGAAAGGGGALPPYVPPGAGTGGAAPPASASTAAASGSAAPGSVQQGGGAAGAGAPVVAGSGAGVAAGLPDADVNPDLVLAQHVLDGLVRGTNATPETFNGGWIRWAVAVLRTPAGATHTVIASSVGGGVYLPELAYFPFAARTAPLDPALPWGWGEQFMGWDKPTVLLAAHANEVCDSVAGLRRSAMVTTEENASRPPGWDDFSTVPVISILHSPGPEPILDGEYRHRLASLDAGLDGQVNALVKNGLSRAVAGPITEAVVAAADQAMVDAPAGMAPLIDRYDHDSVLSPLRRGEPVDWEDHYRHLAEREGGAVLHPMMAGGLLDLDDSEASNNSRRVYWHYYRAGLLGEMLRCWRLETPSLHDVVYCAMAAGFGQEVAAVLAQASSSGSSQAS